MARLDSARSGSWRPWRCLAVVLGASLAGCGTVGYSPYPLDLPHKLPADAFARCREVLLDRYGTLAHSDAHGFRLESAWQPVADPPGERRATIYRDQQHPDSLAIVVELRRLAIPLVGVPHWTSPRGDQAAERELAGWLRESLRDPEVVGQSNQVEGPLQPDK